ncbi:MAG: winged helix-turn-helix transcriptional regulator [Gammaproteobacteria bacterium]|nr:MAG: winged helix-turn-helix transcriptional regulator [Gammaproteobacteria bacterium]
MRHSDYTCNIGCPTEAALEVIGGKWKGVILYHLSSGTKRFNELQRLMPVSQRMLTTQLRGLENDQIVHHQVYPEVPPRVEYSITEFGCTLEPILKVLQAWGEMYLKQLAEIRRESATP